MKAKLITIDTGIGNPAPVKNPILMMKDPTDHMVEYEVEIKQIRVGQGHQIIVLGLKDK